MKKRLLFILLTLFSNYGFSQWSSDPNVNTTVAAGAHNTIRPSTISDGAGGIITVFLESIYDNVNFTYTQVLYAQKLSAAGVRQWPGNGIKMTSSANNIIQSTAVTDGSGGVVSVWIEEVVNGTDQSKIFAQRIDNSGNIVWGATGIEVNGTIAEYELSALIRDDAGSYVFTYDDRVIEKNFCQKISSLGVVEWGTGIQLVDALIPGEHSGALAYQEGTGYKFIWQERYTIGGNEGARYYWQKLNANGTKNGSNFLIDDYVPNAAIKHGYNALAPDGANGFYFFTIGDDNLVAQLYLQHVLSDGTKTFNETLWGMEVDASIGKLVTHSGGTGVEKGVSAVADGSGGVVVAWTDTRGGNDGIYAQRFDVAGTKLWGALDLAVAPEFTSGDFYDEHLKMHPDGDFLFLINKASPIYREHFYVQKVSPTGATKFASGGLLASGRDSRKYGEMVVTGDKIVLVWEDRPMGSGRAEILAQPVYSFGILPVKFAGFNAVYNNGTTKLVWSTATEINNDYFEIQRSEDGVSFVAIGKESGVTNSSELKNYTYTDVNAFAKSGFLYYRVKQVDKNGRFDYTATKAVKVPTLALVAIKSYPNPVSNTLNISLGQDTNSATYLLNDIAGKAWLKGSFVNSQEISVTHLPVGVYILNIRSGNQNYREKVIKN